MFLSTPHPEASLKQWNDHLKGLLMDDQRKPVIAMAIRRAKQHIEKLNNKGNQNECKESKSSQENNEES